MMKYMMIAAAGFALAACGGAKDTAKDVADKAEATVETTVELAEETTTETDGNLGTMSKADYLDACAEADGITRAQCRCTLEVYESVGLEFSDLDDTAKVEAAVGNMTMDQSMEMAACFQ